MTLTEIIDGLLDEDEGDSPALNAALAHLAPYTEPITPVGLEAAGFERYREMWQRDIWDSVITSLYWTAAAGMQAETLDGDQSTLPGVRSMGHVLGLVEMLEGGDGA